MTATLNSFRTELVKASSYITASEQMGIPVLHPDINKSFAKFTTEKTEDGRLGIRIGLTVIKGVGEGVVRLIEEDRDKNGEYRSFEDFLVRGSAMGIKRNTVEYLIWASALDCFDYNRATMVRTAQTELETLAVRQSRKIEGQLSIFDAMEQSQGGMSDSDYVTVYEAEEYPHDAKLAYEKEAIGLYLSGHPLAPYAEKIDRTTDFTSMDAQDMIAAGMGDRLDDDKQVVMAGIINRFNIRYTKNKTQMATLEMEDLTGPYEAVVFGKIVDAVRPYLLNGNRVILTGRRHMRGDVFSVFVDRMYPVDKAPDNLKKPDRGYAYSTAPKEPPAGSGMTEVREAVIPENGRSKCVKIRFNKLPSSPEYNMLMNLLVYFHGNCPVDVIFTSDGSSLRLDPVCFIDPSPEVLDAVIRFAGRDNVEFISN